MFDCLQVIERFPSHSFNDVIWIVNPYTLTHFPHFKVMGLYL